MKKVVVIGGGASGLMAAISAVREGVHVTLLEAGAHVGRPILATGNGRCNLTNRGVAAGAYNHPAFVGPALERYGAEEVLAVFAGLGLVTAEEEDGRVYPLSRTASSVVDVLRGACDRLGVQTVCGMRVRSVRAIGGGGFRVLVEEGRPWEADRVVVATGGGTDLLSGLGHGTVPFGPVLCSLATDTDPFRGLDGVRARTRVSVLRDGDRVACEEGEVLFRKYGVSGIVVFDLSRFAKPGDVLSLDFLSGWELGDVAEFSGQFLDHALEATETWGTSEPSYAEVLAGLFHPRVATAILRDAGLRPSDSATAEGVGRAVRSAKDFRVRVTGIGDARHAQVTRGGADVAEFDPATLESRLVPGLFACGETLDVDGPCGGYNLQWAWASGLTAGQNAAESW